MANNGDCGFGSAKRATPRQFEDLPRQEAYRDSRHYRRQSSGTPLAQERHTAAAVRGDNRLQSSATFLQARVTQSSVRDALSPNLLLRFSGPVDDPFGFYRSRNPRD